MVTTRCAEFARLERMDPPSAELDPQVRPTEGARHNRHRLKKRPPRVLPVPGLPFRPDRQRQRINDLLLRVQLGMVASDLVGDPLGGRPLDLALPQRQDGPPQLTVGGVLPFIGSTQLPHRPCHRVRHLGRVFRTSEEARPYLANQLHGRPTQHANRVGNRVRAPNGTQRQLQALQHGNPFPRGDGFSPFPHSSGLRPKRPFHLEQWPPLELSELGPIAYHVVAPQHAHPPVKGLERLPIAFPFDDPNADCRSNGILGPSDPVDSSHYGWAPLRPSHLGTHQVCWIPSLVVHLLYNQRARDRTLHLLDSRLQRPLHLFRVLRSRCSPEDRGPMVKWLLVHARNSSISLLLSR